MKVKDFKIAEDEDCLQHCVCTHCKREDCDISCSFCLSQKHPCPCDRCSNYIGEEVES